MKAQFKTLTLVALLGASIGTTAFAHEDYSEGGTAHWLQHVMQSTSQPSANAMAPLGYAVSGQGDRAVAVGSDTRYLNVTRGEAVQISVGGKKVTWMFDTLGTPTFSLDKIIPGAGGVTVYVAPSSLEIGG